MSRRALEPTTTPLASALLRDLQQAKEYVVRRTVPRVPGLLPLDELVFAKADGKRTISDLSLLCGLSNRETLHVVVRMIQDGYLSLERGPRSSKPPEIVEVDDPDDWLEEDP